MSTSDRRAGSPKGAMVPRLGQGESSSRSLPRTMERNATILLLA
jgi:hypothetical protein